MSVWVAFSLGVFVGFCIVALIDYFRKKFEEEKTWHS